MLPRCPTMRASLSSLRATRALFCGTPSTTARSWATRNGMGIRAQLHERLVHHADLVGGRITAGEEELLHALVLDVVQQRALRRAAVAPRAPGLLVIRLEACRQVVVHHEPDVGLVDAEAERVGGDHDAHGILHERVLVLLALAGVQPAVVDRYALAGVAQPFMRGLRLANRRAVDDACAGDSRTRPSRRAFFSASLVTCTHAVVQVGPMHARVDHLHARTAELLHDVGDNGRRRRGGQREHRWIAEGADRTGELQECRPEVVAPLGDAVRLVDDEQRRGMGAERGHEAFVGRVVPGW